jgi:antitoxin CptB
MTDDVASRRRRAALRAGHRGTKEMDWLLGRFADAHVSVMPVHQLEEFERLLEMPDPLLQDMIVYPEIAPAGEFVELVRRLRTFHGLE